ncbi:Hypothetical predicted protein [Lecanosticta acicola]|uniref:Ankyrin repeat protein n=1 Tax=Lecanosticta acicola TaxID=111012 RepID=A0AAI8YYG4_9PEZI|nr:Hypothetical predicted protein [Lecanosticta acicola]
MDSTSDPFSPIRPDDALCCSVIDGDLPGIEDDILSLIAKNPIAGLTRAITLAIRMKNVSAFSLLLKHAEVDDDIAEAAAQTEDPDIFQVILDHNWPIDRNLRRRSIPSLLIFSVCNVVFLDWLLQKGADPNAISILNETALSFAIREGTLSAVKRLLVAGTDVFRGDLFHAAASRECSSDVTLIVDLLVERGVPLDTYEFDNDIAKPLRYGYKSGTALHVACEKHNYHAVRAF